MSSLDDISTIRVLAKSLGPSDVTELDLFSEVYGNLLARELSLNTPQPGLVEISDLFVQAARMADQPPDVRPGIAVGSEFIYPVPPLSRNERLQADELTDAVRIFGYDLLVKNPDRYTGNPNCTRYQGRLLAFDFNQAFGFLREGAFAEEPWRVSDLRIARQHILHAPLHYWHERIDFGPLVTEVAALTPDRLRKLAIGLPEEWLGWVAPIVAHISAIQSNLREFEVELLRSVI